MMHLRLEVFGWSWDTLCGGWSEHYLQGHFRHADNLVWAWSQNNPEEAARIKAQQAAPSR